MGTYRQISVYVWWGVAKAHLTGLFQASQGQSSILGVGRTVSIVGDPWRMSEGEKDEGLSALGGSLEHPWWEGVSSGSAIAPALQQNLLRATPSPPLPAMLTPWACSLNSITLPRSRALSS